MNRADRRQQGKSSIELIEEAVHLLRAAPLAALTTYYLGALPFVLGLLYFWADMSRSAFAHQHLAGAALGMAALFLWMKFCQALFARKLRALLAGQSLTPLTLGRCQRIFLTQTLLQPAGLFLLPLAAIPALPFGWVYAFYQNVTALAGEESVELRALLRKSQQQAALWPGQNHILLAVLLGFGFYVFLNWTTVCLALPGLVKMLFGVESVFTRGGLSLFNTTFFAAMFGLTYLCVDPIVKAVYALRCFYGESLRSGEDLRAELKHFVLPSRCMVAWLLLALTARGVEAADARITERGKAATEPREAFGVRRIPALSKDVSHGSEGNRRDAAHSKRFATSGGTQSPRSLLTCWAIAVQGIPNGLDAQPATASVSPAELDRAIQTVIQQRKYAWRMPREKLVEPEAAEQGIIARFLDRAWKMLRQWLSTLADWVGKWLRRLFHRERNAENGGSGYGWIMSLQILLYALVAASAAALVILLYRAWQKRRAPPAASPSEPIQPTPDLADENVDAAQLPEDGWTRLAGELLARGELRLALRAFYLASLAQLAGRNLISLAKFKSNRDYEGELRRRGHSFPNLLPLFGENVLVFERIWYGLHDINGELVNQFAANVERIKSGA